jgi:hypothetical protein
LPHDAQFRSEAKTGRAAVEGVSHPPDPPILAHQEWLGYVQPSGLVVSIPALIEARAYVNRNILRQEKERSG